MERATAEMIDAAEENIRADHRAGKISKEQFQKELLIVTRARRQAVAENPAPQPNVEGADYMHVGYQWRGRATTDAPWGPWHLGHCPALTLKGAETEERRIFALANTGKLNDD